MTIGTNIIQMQFQLNNSCSFLGLDFDSYGAQINFEQYSYLFSRLGRTSEFSIYGQGQQRKAVIEATRLLENGKIRQKDCASLVGEMSSSRVAPQHFKDVAKKWQKFVTQVW